MLFYFNCDLNAVCLSGLCVFSMQCHWHGLLSVSMVFSSHIPSFVYCDIFRTWCYIHAFYNSLYPWSRCLILRKLPAYVFVLSAIHSDMILSVFC